MRAVAEDKGQFSPSCPSLLFIVGLRVPWAAGIQQGTETKTPRYMVGASERQAHEVCTLGSKWDKEMWTRLSGM